MNETIPAERIADYLSTGAHGTEWTPVEIYKLGEALLDWCNATITLGHSTPGSTLDYKRSHTGSLPHDFLADFIVWTSGRKKFLPGAEDRIREEIVKSGWSKAAAVRLSEQLSAVLDGEVAS